MVYFISDLHFHHENVIKFDNRPFSSVEEMNEQLVKNWNEVVEKGDDVYILGDFCWKTAQDKEYRALTDKLRGRKHLLLGNHDPKHFNHTFERQFTSIDDIKEIKYNKQHLILCHYPIVCYKADYNDNCWMLYGHVHVTREYDLIRELTCKLARAPHPEGTNRGQLMNVGCMMSYINYRPQTLETIKEAWAEMVEKKE